MLLTCMGIAASGNQVAFPMTGHGSVRHLRGEICQVYLCIVLDMYSGVVTPGSGGVDGRCSSGRAARRSFSTRIRAVTLHRRSTNSSRGTPHYLQHERRGQLCGQCRRRKFVWRAQTEPVNRRQYRTRAEARPDIFDYIERWHNPRQRRRLEMQQLGRNS